MTKQHPHSLANLAKGRLPKGEGKVKVTVTLPPDVRDYLMDLGGGPRKVGAAIEMLVDFYKERAVMFYEEFNGFTGYGETAREAQIACAYAAAFIPMDADLKEQRYEDLPVTWLLDPEGQMRSLTSK